MAVKGRVVGAAEHGGADIVVEITEDCPIIDPILVDEVIGLYQESSLDYVSNTEPSTFPDGLDTEVFSFVALEMAHEQATKSFEREHVTPFIYNNDQFKCFSKVYEKDYKYKQLHNKFTKS